MTPPRRSRPIRSGRVGATAAAAFSAAVAVCAVLGSGTAVATAHAPETSPTDERAVAVVVSVISPRAVRPGSDVRVSGTVVNRGELALSDVAIRLVIRSTPIVSRSELAGAAVAPDPVGTVAATAPITASLPGHGRAPFSVTVAASRLGLGGFGVYPLGVEAVAHDAIAQDDLVGFTPTFLPWVPAERGAPGFAPTRLAWVWPLVDTPDRSATSVFPDDRAADAVAARGRLGGLVAGAAAVAPGTVAVPTPTRVPGRHGRRGHVQLPPPDAQRPVPLTWAVDPSLLQAIADMADGYQVASGNSTHAGTGSAAARSLLSRLSGALTAGDASAGGTAPRSVVMALPYADADVVALRRNGLRTDITTAVDLGRQIARGILGDVVDNRLGWAPDGYATRAALRTLAVAGITSVVLNEGALPLSSALTFTPTGVAALPLTTRTGRPGSGRASDTAYLSDTTLDAIVDAADGASVTAARTAATAALPTTPTPSSLSPTTSTPPPVVSPSGTTAGTASPTPTPSPSVTTGTEPSAPLVESLVGGVPTERLVEQRFLAETALITAERPGDARSIVVAPTRRWAPYPALAAAFAADTGRVPWLRGITLTDPSLMPSDSAPTRGDLTYPDTAQALELSRDYLTDAADGVRAMRHDNTLFRSILAPPVGAAATALEDAILRCESSAWRTDSSAGYELRDTVADELRTAEDSVTISSSKRVITLASRRGTIPVTISNGLDQAVVVRLQVAVGTARVTAQDTALHTVDAKRKITEEVTAVVNQAGLFTVTVQLLTPDGRPYGDPVALRLRSTAYGELALGITGGALAVLFVAVAVRLTRRAMRARRAAST